MLFNLFHGMSFTEMLWIAIGLGGQMCFGGRFILQWLVSERTGKSVIPAAFWHMSIAGSLILFVYSIHTRDPVYFLGQSLGILIYARNLHMVIRERRQLSAMKGELQQTRVAKEEVSQAMV